MIPSYLAKPTTDRTACAILLVGFLTIVTPAASQPASDPAELDIDGNVRMGVQYLDLDGDEAKFNEYRNLGNDFEFAAEELILRGYYGPYYLVLEGLNLDRNDDRSAAVEGGRYGRFEFGLGWDETSHHFADDVRVLDAPKGGGSLGNPRGRRERRGLLDLDLSWQTGTVDLEFTPFSNLDLRADYLRRDKNGLRPMITGVEPSGDEGDSGKLQALEFPEPIDYDVNEVGNGLRYRGRNWTADADYRYVDFDNNTDAITSDDPFALVGIDASEYGVAVSRLAAYPSSTSHTVTATGGIWDLPYDSRVTVTGSWGRITRDDDTVNDLDGKVDKILANAVLSSRPIDPLSINAKVNYYDYNDRSDEIAWIDGSRGIGESGSSRNSKTGVINGALDWSRLRSGLDANYRFSKVLSVGADYAFEKYWRNYDRNGDTNEHIVGGRIKLDPVSWVTLRVGYHYSDRENGGSDTTLAAAPSMHFFEWDRAASFDRSGRRRHHADGQLSVSPTEQLSMGFSFTWTDDDYDDGWYGLHGRDGYTLGADASYTICDRASVFAYYSRDDSDSRILTRSDSNSAGGGPFVTPENGWNTRVTDPTNTVGGGISLILIPERLTLEVGADHSFAKSEFDSRNADFNWLDTEIKTTQVRADLEYSWTERLSTGFRYLYQRYRIDDALTGVLTPNLSGTDVKGSNLDYFIFLDAYYGDYDAHLMTLTVSYQF